MAKFRNLVFDLGNVIIDIDYAVTVAEFQKLVAEGSGINFGTIVSYSAQNQTFDHFETGHLSAADFVATVKKHLSPSTTDAQVIAAWNSILIDYPPAKFQLLTQLKQRYRTMALSNINEIHVEAIDQAARQRFGVHSFADFFHAAYYSNQMGFRKPDTGIYKMLIEKENLNPAETFFVDDKAENVEAALSIGLQAYQLKDRNKLNELLKELNII